MKIELKFRTIIEIKDEDFDIVGEIAKIKPNNIGDIYLPIVSGKDSVITDCLKRKPKFEFIGYSVIY